ncbi:hypothetical protein Tco_1296257 [Tanacetum coccineum]
MSLAIKSRLKITQTRLVGFVGDVVRPLGKIELEVTFGDEGLYRKVIHGHSSPFALQYHIGDNGFKNPLSYSSSIHSMVKFLTPKGIATLVTQTVIISECRRLEKKKTIDKEALQKTVVIQEVEPGYVSLTEEKIVNPAYPEQLVTIERNLSKGCKEQLRNLLKKNMDVFTWEPSDTKGVPRRIIEHSLNVNLTVEPFF